MFLDVYMTLTTSDYFDCSYITKHNTITYRPENIFAYELVSSVSLCQTFFADLNLVKN